MPYEHSIDILIIGAGPAGLAMAGRLRTAGIDFRIIEKSANVADRWHHHYDRLHLHTIKRLSNLPHLEFPDHYPVYIPRDQLVEYFEAYARHFSIEPEFGVEVSSITKTPESRWRVESDRAPVTASHIVIATGVNNRPNFPEWVVEGQFTSNISHSIDYRNSTSFSGQRVLVVGMGNTGAEIALDLAEHNVPTWISVRGSINLVPRDLNGRPVQETGQILAKLPFGMGDWIGAKIQGLYFGDLSKYGLKQSTIPPAVELRKTGKTPVIDIGTIKAIKLGKITVVGEVTGLTASGVRLKDSEDLAIDEVILATGYRSCLGDLIERMPEFLDPRGYPRGPIGTGYHEGLCFVGFNNYKLGGILGTISTDSETILQHFVAHTGK